MKKINNIIRCLSIFIIPVLVLSACEDDVDLKDLGIEPKMVLYCHLSPSFDTTVVFLSNSQPLLSSNSSDLSVIKNATVEISKDNKTWKKFIYNAIKERYVLSKNDFPIEEGESYYIRASSPDYSETISSSCTVPYYRDVNLKNDIKLAYDYGMLIIKCDLSWTDYVGEFNYYCLTSYSIYENYDSTKIINCSNIYNDSTYNYLFSDEEYDGCTLDATYYVYPDFETDIVDTVYFSFVQMDKNNYLYETTAMNNYFGDFLGFTEPTLLYNNIKNGYGLFSAIVFKNYYFVVTDETIYEY